MQVRSRLILSLAAFAVLGCSADRAAAPPRPVEAEKAAAEFERMAAEVGIAAGPTAALTYSSAAAALRGGARVSEVDIRVGGVTEKWNAFGHEIEFELPPGASLHGLTEPPPLRAFLAWRSSESGFRVIHLLSADESGPIGRLFLAAPGDEMTTTVPSFLIYAEERDALWQGVSGEQTSRIASTGAACPPRPALASNSPAPPSCVEATFEFGFANVQAQPFVLRFSPGASPVAGTRALSMANQPVAGVKVKVTLTVVTVPPIADRPAGP